MRNFFARRHFHFLINIPAIEYVIIHSLPAQGTAAPIPISIPFPGFFIQGIPSPSLNAAKCGYTPLICKGFFVYPKAKDAINRLSESPDTIFLIFIKWV